MFELSGPHDALSTPPVTPLHNPVFGSAQNQVIPFNFHPQTPTQSNLWAPPPNFSPTKLFQEDLRDIDMADASPSPPKPEQGRNGKTGKKRIYKPKHKLNPSSLSMVLSRGEDDEDQSGESGEEDEGQARTSQNTSHHYTLNMPSPPAPKSDTPYILLG